MAFSGGLCARAAFFQDTVVMIALAGVDMPTTIIKWAKRDATKDQIKWCRSFNLNPVQRKANTATHITNVTIRWGGIERDEISPGHGPGR